MGVELNGSEIANGVVALVVGTAVLAICAKLVAAVFGLFPKLGIAPRTWKARDYGLVIASSLFTLMAVAGVQFAQDRFGGGATEVTANKVIQDSQVNQATHHDYKQEIQAALDKAGEIQPHIDAPEKLDTKLTPNPKHSKQPLSMFDDMGDGWLKCKDCQIVGKMMDIGEGLKFYERAPVPPLR